MNIKYSIPTLVAAIAINLGVIASDVQAGLVTWTLEGVTPFEFGDTASGYFTIDQAIANGPLGPYPLAGWNIEITGGSNPNIPNITFSDEDSGCLVACARIFRDIVSPTVIDFRTPLAADNTYYELALYVGAIANELIFPRSAELVVPTFPFPTNIQYNQYRPITNDVFGILQDSLTAEGRIINTQAVPEPATFGLLTMGFAALSFVHCWRRKRCSRLFQWL